MSTWLWSRWADVLRFPAVAAVAGIAAGVALNYVLSARLVFRPAGDDGNVES